MSTEYSGSATWHSSVTLPSDGDPRNATSINAGLEDLTDRTLWLWDKFQGGTWSPSTAIVVEGAGFDFVESVLIRKGAIPSGGWMNVVSGGKIDVYGSVNVKNGGTVTVESGGLITLANGSDLQCSDRAGYTNLSPTAFCPFSFSDSDPPGIRLINDGVSQYSKFLATGGGLAAGFEAIPQLATVTHLTAMVQGDPGQHGALPGSMPQLRLYRKNNYGTVTLIDSQTDESGDVATYESVHSIFLSGLSQSVKNASGDLQIVLTNEGTSGVAGLRVIQVQVGYTLKYFIWS